MSRRPAPAAIAGVILCPEPIDRAPQRPTASMLVGGLVPSICRRALDREARLQEAACRVAFGTAVTPAELLEAARELEAGSAATALGWLEECPGRCLRVAMARRKRGGR